MRNENKTHCPKGHPYDETNTLRSRYKAANGEIRFGRKCAECLRQKWRDKGHEYHARRKPDPKRDERIDTYRKRHPEKTRARRLVTAAVRSGKLVKPNACEWCGQYGLRLDGSHDDYSKPLEVEWLCRRCHMGKDRPNDPLTKERAQAEALKWAWPAAEGTG